MWEVFYSLCKARGVAPSAVALALGFSKSTVSAWKRGEYMPKQDKLLKIAEYFGVSLDYLTTGTEKVTYYADPETEALAQRMRDDPNFRLLFSAAADATPEELQMVYNMLLLVRKKEMKESED